MHGTWPAADSRCSRCRPSWRRWVFLRSGHQAPTPRKWTRCKDCGKAPVSSIDVETTRIDAQRSFVDFDDFWSASTLSTTIAPQVASMAPADLERLKQGVRARLPADNAGRIV